MSVHVYLGSMYIPVYKCMCMHTNIHASQLCTHHPVVRSGSRNQTVSLPSKRSPGSPQRERVEARVPVCAVGFMHQFQVMKLRA